MFAQFPGATNRTNVGRRYPSAGCLSHKPAFFFTTLHGFHKRVWCPRIFAHKDMTTITTGDDGRQTTPGRINKNISPGAQGLIDVFGYLRSNKIVGLALLTFGSLDMHQFGRQSQTLGVFVVFNVLTTT